MDFLDHHSGSIIALATIFLAITTFGYMVFTWKLARGQYLSSKRELIEKLYKPLNALLEEILWGSNPRFLLWNRLKEDEPFLAFHHLMPPSLRRNLDQTEGVIDSSGGYEDKYRRLFDLVHSSIAGELGVAITSGRACVLISAGPSNLASFFIPSVEIDTAISHCKLERLERFVLQLLDDGRIVGEKELTSADSFSKAILELRSVVEGDPLTKVALDEYRVFLGQVGRLQQSIRHEIEKGSRV